MKKTLWKKLIFMYIVSFFSSLIFTMSKLYDGAGTNWIVLCKGFDFELFFLGILGGFYSPKLDTNLHRI